MNSIKDEMYLLPDEASSYLGYLNDSGDGSHDISHILRVWANVKKIQKVEGGSLEILLAATILHDCVHVEKSSLLRSSASTISAARSREILKELNWDSQKIDLVTHAIESHSYSAGIAPQTIEAKILQDADRLDAIGAIGIARCFYVAGRMGSALYDPNNPQAVSRKYQDKKYAIEHFHVKLLNLSDDFKTNEGIRLAEIRALRLRRFVEEFMEEIEG
ncbi:MULTISPECIES: HD domain-containing protein [unclassified Pseudomonas]|uniref:HD domain-containing protein n=1 Tax=unclassified Pseudomonas TaxID=196821 RepID=UPI002114F24E|nr:MULTISPECIES: HD domain-containing protein [unclassified Pseudomonas]